MKQRILALLLAAGLCLGLIAAAPALAFSDVSGEELSEAVEVLSGLGIVSGYSDGSYHPDDALRRAQPDTMSPIEAMQLLYDLKKKLPN